MRFTFLLPNIEISGGNRATFELTNELVELGHDVEVIYPLVPGRDGKGIFDLRKTGVQIVKGCRNFLFRKPWFDLKAKLSSRWFFRKGRLQLPDSDYLVVTWWAHVELVTECANELGKPIHFMRSLEYWGGPALRVTQAYEINVPRVVTSETLMHQYQEKFDAVAGIVPDGVSQVFFSPVERNATESKVLTVGMVYRRQPLKRMRDGIDALLQLASESDIPFKVVLFGERLRSMDKERLSPQLDWKHTNFPTGEALVKIYHDIDVFLFPSGPEEAFGLPPLEAMASKCAVVSTRVGAVESYAVDGVSALLCEPGDIAAMTRHLKRLVEDVAYRQSISVEGRSAAEAFSWSNSAKQFLRVLDSLE